MTDDKPEIIREVGVVVTPDRAREMLRHNKCNRTIRPAYYKAIAEDIRQGGYVYDENPIKFDWFGNLLDGQHRLMGIITADIAVVTDVVYNMDPKAMQTIDCGLARSAADVLVVAGVVKRHSRAISSAIRWINGYAKGRYWHLGKAAMANRAVLGGLEQRPELKSQAAFTAKLTAPKLISGGVMLFLYHEMVKKDPKEAKRFFGQLHSGLQEEKDVIWYLRQILLNQLVTKTGKLTPGVKILTVVRAWNFLRDGKLKKNRQALMKDISAITFLKIR